MPSEDDLGEIWAKVSEIDKKVALNEQSIKVNRERIERALEKSAENSENMFKKWNSDATRANNIKVAVIGIAATSIPTILMFVLLGGN